MKESDWPDEKIQTCPIYEAGLPIETVARKRGIDPREIVKLASNENPLGPSPLAKEAISRGVNRLHDYPDGGCYLLRERLAKYHGLQPDQFLLGNGSNEVLEMIAGTYLKPGYKALFGEYGFIVYRLATLHAKAEPIAIPMPGLFHDLAAFRDRIDEQTRIVFIASPNNPTGDTVPAADLLTFVRDLPEHVLFCFDEAYTEYLDEPVDFRPLIAEGRRIVCVRTFSKIHGLAGLRIGYAYSNPDIILNMERIRQPFNVGTISQMGALAALDDQEHQEKTKKLNRESLDFLIPQMRELGAVVRRSEANFFLLEVPSARDCFEALQNEGVIVRPLDGYRLPQQVRVSTGTMEQNHRFVDVFSRWWKGGKR